MTVHHKPPIEGFHVTSYQANFASHPTRDQGTGQNRARIGTHLYAPDIEGLQDAVHTRFCPTAWFPFCMVRYREKQQNVLLLVI